MKKLNIFELAKSVALHDPRMALALLEGQRRPKDYTMKFEFASGQLGYYLDDELGNKGVCDVLVYGLEYTVEAPNMNRGSVFKATEDIAFIGAPYMAIQLEIDSCPSELLTDGLQPLNLAAQPSSIPDRDCCTPVFALFCDDTLRARITLTRNFEEAELPLNVTLVAHTILLGGFRRLNGLSVVESCSLLEERYKISVNHKAIGLVRPID